MVRPKAHVAASRKNGALGAKKKTFKHVPVLDDGCEPGKALDGTFTAVYRPKPKKGYFYMDELACMMDMVRREKHVSFESSPPPKPKDKWTRADAKAEFIHSREQAVKKIVKLNKDPKTKEQKLKKLVKVAGYKYKR